MARALEREHAESGRILFELDTLELAAANRLEVSGRWFGARGRRFLRPTLTLLVQDGDGSRSLADLEHKPWAAEDGELWTAIFPVEPGGREVLGLELAVAPDIAITLPAPRPQSRQRGDGSGATGRALLAAGARPPAEERQRVHNARVRDELERAAQARAEVTSALARRDAAIGKLEAVLRERDEALAAAGRAARERDAALSQRDQAAAQVGRVRAAARAQLTRLQDQISRERSERERAAAADDGPPDVPAPLEVPAASDRRTRARRSRSRALALPSPSSQAEWIRRGVALAVLIAVFVALLIVLHSP